MEEIMIYGGHEMEGVVARRKGVRRPRNVMEVENKIICNDLLLKQEKSKNGSLSSGDLFLSLIFLF